MYVLEALLLTTLLFTCMYSSYTDIRNGIIQNKILLISGGVCCILNILYYSCFAQEYFKIFIIDFVILVVLSIMMYVFNLWAAGDSKLLFLVVLAIPARYFDTTISTGLAPAIYIVVFTFSISFIYIVIESIILRIKNRDKIHFFQKQSILIFFKNYFFCSVYIITINYLISLLFPVFAQENLSLITIADLFISIVIYKYPFFFKKSAICIMSILAICSFGIYGIIFGFYIPDLKIYLYLAIIIFFRSIAERYNYCAIPTSTVKAGMILSFATVAIMTPSRIKGLPENSTEDMRSRLTNEQVDSILKWETSKYGQHEITIVRKIPFAVFITLGAVVLLFFRIGAIKF